MASDAERGMRSLSEDKLNETAAKGSELIKKIANILAGNENPVTMTALAYVVAFGLLEVYATEEPLEGLDFFNKMVRQSMVTILAEMSAKKREGKR